MPRPLPSRLPRRARARGRLHCVAAGLACAAALLGTGGCGRPPQFTLRQPTAPPAQQALTLTLQSAVYATVADRRVCVLSFPVPGRDSPRAFAVYLNLPPTTGAVRLHPTDAGAARGLLIQEVGELAGRTDFTGGSARIRPDWLVRGRYRVELHAYAPGGLVFQGSGYAQESPRLVRAFERQYAADVAALMPPPLEPAGPEATMLTASPEE